jgi:hypothetical protein
MLLCLSSGYRPVYRHDVLRALSQPAGSKLRFRYDLGLVAESLKEDIEKNGLAGEEVCIAYLDRSKPGTTPAVVPIRAGTVIKASMLGDFCVIDFRLSDYLVARDIAAFDRELRSVVGTLPAWDPTGSNSLIGKFCDRLQRDLTSLVKSNAEADWQRTCKTLSAHADFNAEPFFYRVQTLVNLDKQTGIDIKDGAYRVPADTLVELQLLHYAPALDLDRTEMRATSWLTAEASDNVLAFVTTSRLPIDSRNDLKAVRMRTATVSHDSDGMITLIRQPASTTEMAVTSGPIWDFDLPLRVTRNLGRMLRQGTLLGVLVACQGLVVIANNASVSNKPLAVALAVVFGLATGFVAVFNLRKP